MSEPSKSKPVPGGVPHEAGHVPHDAAHAAHDPETLPPPDGVNLTGTQLIALMGVTLLAALIFLDIVSG